MSDAQQKDMAAALALEMLDTATRAQRETGPMVDVVVEISEATARALGFAGEGKITLSLRPCTPPGWPNHVRTPLEEKLKP